MGDGFYMARGRRGHVGDAAGVADELAPGHGETQRAAGGAQDAGRAVPEDLV